VTPPQGETLEDAAARLLPALTKAIGKQKLPGGSVVVVLRPYAWAVVEAMASGRGFGAVVDILDQEGAISTRVTDLATLSELPMSLGLAH
jgi:hypothetical protein